jgi:hypothetical protein
VLEMTIANIHVDRDKVWAVSDSGMFMGSELVKLQPKPIVHQRCRAVSIHRGLHGIHMAAERVLADKVNVERALPELVATLRAECARMRREYPEARHDGVLFLAGWRHSRQAFGFWRFASEDDWTPQPLPVPFTTLCPASKFVPPNRCRDASILLNICSAQKRMSDMNREAGGHELGIAGPLHLIKMTRTSIERSEHPLRELEEVRAAMQAA